MLLKLNGVISRYNRYLISKKQSRYHMKTFHQTTRSMLYMVWDIWKIFFELCNTIPGQMLSDIEEIKVLGAYLHYSLIKVALFMYRGGSAHTYRLCWCVYVHVSV